MRRWIICYVAPCAPPCVFGARELADNGRGNAVTTDAGRPLHGPARYNTYDPRGKFLLFFSGTDENLYKTSVRKIEKPFPGSNFPSVLSGVLMLFLRATCTQG